MMQRIGQKLEETRKDSAVDLAEGARPCRHGDFRFWPPELKVNTFLLSEAIQFVGLCYSGPGD